MRIKVSDYISDFFIKSNININTPPIMKGIKPMSVNASR